MSLLKEATRSQLINKSRNAGPYKDQSKGKNRYARRVYSRQANTVSQYNKIDMNTFFKEDRLKVGIPVIGETRDYIVNMEFNGVLEDVQRRIKNNNNKLEFKVIYQALMSKFNSGDVYIGCNCLHPDTKIKLLDGTTRTIEQMKIDFDKGEKLWVYSVDETGEFKPGEVTNVIISGEAEDFIKITLDNDYEILTTPEHLYMLRDGTYLEAEKLEEGFSLMPLYFSEANGYELVKSNSSNRYRSVYKEVAKHCKQEEMEDTKKRVGLEDNMGYEVAIHHKDFNKNNNSPDNLQIMTAREHWEYHARLCGPNRPISEKLRDAARRNAYIRNANPTPAMVESRKKWQEKGKMRNYDEDRRKQQAEIMKNNIKNRSDIYCKESRRNRTLKALENNPEIRSKISASQKKVWEAYTEEEYKKRCNINRESNRKAKLVISEKLKKHWSNLSEDEKKERIKNVCLSKIRKVLEEMIRLQIPLTQDNYDSYRYDRRVKEKRDGGVPLTKYFNNINEAVEFFQLNHKVKRVEKIKLPKTPVYDISIKDFPNFLVEGGVILHNCPDNRYRFSYFQTINDYRSGEPETRPSDITNPTDNKGAGCKHILLVLSNLNWLLKVCSVINNYIHYSKDHLFRNYADIIFPKLYGVKYQGDVQLSILDDEDADLDTSNAYGRSRTRFKPNNPYRFTKRTPTTPENQLELDIEEEEPENNSNLRRH